MKKMSLFLVFSLLLVIFSLIFVLQNNNIIVQIKFLRWSLSNVPLGFLVIISLLVGVIIIWLVSLVLYIAAVTKNRKLMSDSESKINKLEEDKRQLETKIEKLQAALNEKTQKPGELEVSEIKNINENENKEG
jgi:uncharacterized integral membrane protein